MVPSGSSREQRALWSGFSDALGRAVELVGTTVVFVLAGLWIDGRLGTRPIFTLVLGVSIAIAQLLMQFILMKQVQSSILKWNLEVFRSLFDEIGRAHV